MAISISGIAQTHSKVGNQRPPAEKLNEDRLERRIYVSGHSLTNPRTFGVLEQITNAAGVDIYWDIQYLEGSSIRLRREGPPGQGAGSSYRFGADKAGRQADPLVEFAARPGNGRAIDLFIVTEQHAVLGALVWQDTIASLRQFHDRFIETNTSGQTVFFEPWLSVDDRTAPHRWIAYERAAAPVWSCIVDAANRSLEQDGRASRILSMPMGLAMAELVAYARASKGTAIAEGLGPSSQLNGLFTDHVHLGPIGDYYIAAVLFHYLFPGLRIGDITSPDIDRKLQIELNHFAVEFAVNHAWNKRLIHTDECRSYIKTRFIDQFVSYYSLVDFKQNGNFISSTYRRWKLSRDLHANFKLDSGANPFNVK